MLKKYTSTIIKTKQNIHYNIGGGNLTFSYSIQKRYFWFKYF